MVNITHFEAKATQVKRTAQTQDSNLSPWFDKGLEELGTLQKQTSERGPWTLR